MTTITQDIADIAGVDDNTSWTFYVKEIRLSDAGDAIVSTKQVRKYPVAGVLTVELDPGPAVVRAADGKHYPFIVPDADSALWPLIVAAVSIPPATRHQELVDAVDAWLDLNGGGGGGGTLPELGVTATAAELNILDGAILSTTELNYVDGVTSAIQAQLDAKTTPAAVATQIATAVNALLDGAPGALDTLNELAAAVNDDASFAASVTSALAGKQPLDSDLTAVAALTTTTFGRSLLTQADAAAARSTLGAATETAGTVIYVAAPVGNATTDTAVIQAAHDALPTNGGTILLNRGDYLLSSGGVTFTKPVRLVGQGSAQTTSQAITNLVSNAANATAITCNAEGCRIENLSLINVFATVTSGVGIRMQKAHFSSIDHVYVWGFYDNISVEAGHYWVIGENVRNIAPWRYGLYVRNSDHADSGDMKVRGWFDMLGVTRNATAAIRWESGAGLNVQAKINGGTYKFATGIDCAYTGGVDGADILIQSGTSVENVSGSAIKLVRSSGSNIVSNCVITGVEVANCGKAFEVGVGFKQVVIANNVAANVTVGVDLVANAANIYVGPNVWTVVTTPVNISSTAVAGIRVDPQHRDGDGIVVTDAAEGLQGAACVIYDYTLSLSDAVSATPDPVFSLNVSNYDGGEFSVVLSGLHGGNGPFTLRKTWQWGVDGSGGVTITDGDTYASGSSNPFTGPKLTVTTTTGGFTVKASTGDGNTLAGAKAHIRVEGRPNQFRIGA